MVLKKVLYLGMSMLKYQDQEIRRPDLFFKGWTYHQFTEWLQEYGSDTTTAEHARSIDATIKELEQYEMYEFCEMALIYKNTLCVSV